MSEAKQRSVWLILFDQFKSVVILVLAAAAGLAFGFQRLSEGFAIVAVIAVNTAIGFVSEWRAMRSMSALRKMGQQRARVRRGGDEQDLPADSLVPGDIVIHDGGDIVPADLRIIESNSLRVDEAALTGESVSVNKATDPVDTDSPIAERSNMLFKGTTIVEGSGQGVVVAIGMETELGRVADLADSAQKQASPLQQRDSPRRGPRREA